MSDHAFGLLEAGQVEADLLLLLLICARARAGFVLLLLIFALFD